MKSELLSFEGLDNITTYNPSTSFKHNNEEYICTRVEPLEEELDSNIHFARFINGKINKYEIDHKLNSIPLQDPKITKIKNEYILSGINARKENGKTKWHTEFYWSDSIHSLEFLTSGPRSMKGIVLCELENKLGVFTRPQGIIGGAGKIGYLEVKNVKELTQLKEEDWYNAVLLRNMFPEGYWEGANQAINLGNGLIGVIGHIAHKTINKKGELEKHYYAMSFEFDSKTKTYNEPRIIATRKDFPETPSKRSPELDDIIYPAGITPIGTTNHYYLYCGLSDYSVGKTIIENPFIKKILNSNRRATTPDIETIIKAAQTNSLNKKQ